LIVVDASAALELLLRGASAQDVEALLFAPGESLHAPHLIDVEILQVLRRHVLAGRMAADQADRALDVWRAFPVRRWAHEMLAPRIWALRDTLTAYDTAYVALAEVLPATLVTLDGKLERASGHTAKIVVVD